MHSNLFWRLEFQSKQQRWLISANRAFLFSPWNSQLMRKCTSSSISLELQNWHSLSVTWLRVLEYGAYHFMDRYVYHYDDVIMGAIASQITSLTIVYSTVYSGADQRKHQSSASLAFVWGIHRGPVNSPHKWPVTRKMYPFDDVIMMSFRVCVWCTCAT